LSGYNLHRYRKHLGTVSVLIALIGLAGWRCEVSIHDLATGISKGLALLDLFFPPDWQSLPRMIEPAFVTVLLSLIATPIGAVLSIIFGLAAARNMSPPWLRLSTRTVIALERGLPEIVILLVLIAALGMGPLAGVMALAIGSIGMLGKLVGDAIEEIDLHTVESVESVGATRSQVIRYAVLPQVLPSLVANSMFRFEVNIRASVLLGAVGAGGIGYELSVAMSQLEYKKAMIAALVSFLLVFVAERCSDFLRTKLFTGGFLQ